jgi:hypothetical protein
MKNDHRRDVPETSQANLIDFGVGSSRPILSGRIPRSPFPRGFFLENPEGGDHATEIHGPDFALLSPDDAREDPALRRGFDQFDAEIEREKVPA